MITRKKKNKKKIIKFIPILIALIILLSMFGLIVYLVADGNLLNPVEKQIKELEVKEEQTTVKIQDMVNNNVLSCDAKDNSSLKEAANKITVSFEEEKVVSDSYTDIYGELVEEGSLYIKVNFENIDDNIYLVVKNDYNDETKTINPTDGKGFMYSPSRTALITFFVNVYAKNENCKDEIVRQYSVEVPMINVYSEYERCEGLEKLEVCSRFTWKRYEAVEVNEKIEKYKELKDNKIVTTTNKDGKEETTEKNKDGMLIVIVTIIVAIIAIGCGLVVIKRKGSNKDEEDK